jgi:hypothetical protein
VNVGVTGLFKCCTPGSTIYQKEKIELDYVILPQKAVGIMSISSRPPSTVGSDTTNSFSPTTSTTSSTPSSYSQDSTPPPWIIYHLIEKTIPCELPLRIMFSFNTGKLDETNPVSSSRRLPVDSLFPSTPSSRRLPLPRRLALLHRLPRRRLPRRLPRGVAFHNRSSTSSLRRLSLSRRLQ